MTVLTVPPLFIHRSTTGSSNFKGIQNVYKGSLGSKLAVNSEALEHNGYTQGHTYVHPIMLADLKCFAYNLLSPRHMQIVFNLILDINYMIN